MMPADLDDRSLLDGTCDVCGLCWPQCRCSPTDPPPADDEIACRRAEVARSLRELRRDLDRKIGDVLCELEQLEKLERRGGSCG